MIADDIYEFCQPILDDKDSEEEDKIERLEEELRKQTTLSGTLLDNTILDALWRHRNASKPGTSEAPSRHTVIRKSSPAPWSTPRTVTPRTSPPSSVPTAPPSFSSHLSFSRQRSTAASPLASPRPSPRLALAHPIPQRSSLNAYERSDASPSPDLYGDYGSENVEWLVADDTASNASSTGTGQLSAAAPEWLPQPDMSPYDILRSVLGDRKKNEEIEEALEKNCYDLGATIAQLSGGDSTVQHAAASAVNQQPESIVIGKSMNMEQTRPVTPNTGKSPIVCKYWLASGSCLRADCRFAHDATSLICKYWLAGHCLAGDSCQFSHDPSTLVGALNINEKSSIHGSPHQFYQLQDQYDQSPEVQGATRPSTSTFTIPPDGQFPTFTPMSQHRTRAGQQLSGSRPHSRPTSRPTSRHQHGADSQLSGPPVDDPEAFPTLASLNAKRPSKHHGQRSRHSHNGTVDKDVPGSLAEMVRLSAWPPPGQRKSEAIKKTRSATSSDSQATLKIPQPQHIPWLETGGRANQQYLRHRQEAIKHGGVRNKFLQSAAQAWNRNDARAAKALSLRGQAENEAMRKAHREAAKSLYEERNSHRASNATTTATGKNEDSECYIDLHGLHPEEAIEYLDNALTSHSQPGASKAAAASGGTRTNNNNINSTSPAPRILYAITGTGHHSKNGKDKVGKTIRTWLADCGYPFREFSVPGERGGYVGGILGIDATGTPPPRSDSNSNGQTIAQSNTAAAAASDDGHATTTSMTAGVGVSAGAGIGIGIGIGNGGKIQVLRREQVPPW